MEIRLLKNEHILQNKIMLKSSVQKHRIQSSDLGTSLTCYLKKIKNYFKIKRKISF